MEIKNAFVTGGSSGIGRAICIALAKKGYNVIFSHFDKDDDKANDTLKELKGYGFSVDFVKANIGNQVEREMMVKFINSKFVKIDLLVNNAGISPPKREDILIATEDSFDKVVTVNLKGPYFLTQKIANKMIEDLKAHKNYKPIIINISSVSSVASSPSRGEYCISKAGVSMMTKLYADRLAEFGINVYEISPCIIYTDMTAPVKDKYDDLINNKNLLLQKRWGFPEDVAKAVDALVSDSFPYSTGQVFHIDGGYNIRRL
jgi:3-oxoacyl-[acyl-carrier protein] reductase